MAQRRLPQSVRDDEGKPVKAELPQALRRLAKARSVVKDPLMAFVNGIPGGLKAIYGLLQSSDDDLDAQRIVDAWDRVMGHDRPGSVLIREVLDHAEMAPVIFVGVVGRCLWNFNILNAKAVFAAHYPQMMAASMERAMEPTATEERRIHFQASGHLPTSKGIQIGIQQNNVQREHEPEPGEAPPVGVTARKIVRDLPSHDG